MKKNPLPRLDRAPELLQQLRAHCRLRPGEIWQDPQGRHRVGCLDATDPGAVRGLAHRRAPPILAIQDPPYNLAAFRERRVESFVAWCERFIDATTGVVAPDATLYLWLGADQRRGFQPLPDVMLLMRRKTEWQSRSFVTLRNQRGYGTQKNWMAVRQELLMYTRGEPPFQVVYTDIPKILRGYYKDVGGQRTENTARGRGETLRPGNVWVDVQQVFYRMQENVSGCYAQKPLAAIERLIEASSGAGDTVLDSFAHSGTTLLACERTRRCCLTADLEPVFCEIAIRRLERYRETGKLGWQNGHAFEAELPGPLP